MYMGLDDDASDSNGGVVGGKLGAAGRVPGFGKRSRGCLEAGCCDFASCAGTDVTPATGDRPAKPFPSSYTEVIRASHRTGFDSGTQSWLPRGGPYVPEARAAKKEALRWRRRRTERVTSAAKMVTNKARITEKMYKTRETEGVLLPRGVEPVALGGGIEGPVVDDGPWEDDWVLVAIKSIDGYYRLGWLS